MPVLALRLPWTAIKAARRARLAVDATSVLSHRAWPSDVDLYLHVNNGRFLTLMDLGRTDWIIRTGIMRQLIRRRWQPVAGGAGIRFRRSINLLRRYQLHTRLIWWDERWCYFEQTFIRRAHGDVSARAFAKIAFLTRDGSTVSPHVVMESAGFTDDVRPECPDGLATWIQSPVS